MVMSDVVIRKILHICKQFEKWEIYIFTFYLCSKIFLLLFFNAYKQVLQLYSLYSMFE